MKKTILLFTILFSSYSFSQYCAFFDFKAEEPEMVVSTVNAMMQTEWAKNIEGTKGITSEYHTKDGVKRTAKKDREEFIV